MKRKLNKRAVALLVCLTVILTAAVGVTLAIIFTGTDALENIFTPAQVSCAVVENGQPYTATKLSDGTGISALQVKNTGNTDAYIRASIVVVWKNTDGDVYAKTPVLGTDYNMTLSLGTNSSAEQWVKGGDGFYYFTSPVAANAVTGNLIASASYTANAPAGYSLYVEVVASALQAKPTSVVCDVWKSGVEKIEGTIMTVKGAA